MPALRDLRVADYSRRGCEQRFGGGQLKMRITPTCDGRALCAVLHVFTLDLNYL